jgi:hypothetical protein
VVARIEVTNASFNVDAKNGVATFAFQRQMPPGYQGFLPQVSVAVPVSNIETKTVAVVRKEAFEVAASLLRDVLEVIDLR